MLPLFRYELYKFNDTRAHVLEASYHMAFESTLKSRIS